MKQNKHVLRQIHAAPCWALVFFIFLGVQGCKKEMPTSCDDPLCLNYLSIWQTLLQERNGMSRSYFDAHVAVDRYAIGNLPDGVQVLEVRYTVTQDWAEVQVLDRIPIWIANSVGDTTFLGFPRGQYLANWEIAQLVARDTLTYGPTRILPLSGLAVVSAHKAKQALLEGTGLRAPTALRLFYPKVIGRFNEVVGHPFAYYIWESGDLGNGGGCLGRSLDLSTGVAVTLDGLCD